MFWPLFASIRQVLIKPSPNATSKHIVRQAMIERLCLLLGPFHRFQMFFRWLLGGRLRTHFKPSTHTHIHTQFYWHRSYITYTLSESLRKSALLLFILSAAERRGTPVLLSAKVSDNSGNSPQVAALRRPREIDQSRQRIMYLNSKCCVNAFIGSSNTK